MHRLIRGTTLGLATALALAAAGCAGDDDPQTTTDDPQATEDEEPAVVLASSVEALDAEPFKLEMTMGDMLTATGAMDPANQAGTMDMSVAAQGMQMDFEVITTESDMWVNLGEIGAMLGTQAEWMHMDLSKLGEEGFMGMQPGQSDFSGAADMIDSVGSVERVDDGTFEGQVDLTQAENGYVDQQMLDQLGEDASSLDFTATVDDQGRLSTMTIDMPSAPDVPNMPGTMEMRYYDYGTPVEVTPPSGDEVSEMPDEFYGMFNA